MLRGPTPALPTRGREKAGCCQGGGGVEGDGHRAETGERQDRQGDDGGDGPAERGGGGERRQAGDGGQAGQGQADDGEVSGFQAVDGEGGRPGGA
jgi:hypothetical protein